MALNRFKDLSSTPLTISELNVNTGIVAAGGNTDTFIGLNTKSPEPNTVLIDVGGDGRHNTAIGYASLANQTIGASNTSIGSRSSRLNIAGDYNVSVGFRALEDNVTGSSNTAVGTESMVFLSTGNQNTALGFQALAFSNGSSNVAVGYRASFNNSTGIRNISIGQQSAFNGTTGSDNVSIGYQSLFSNSIGNQNTAIGFQSLAQVLSSNSTAIGHQAGFSLSTGVGTFIGTFAGQVTTGTANVFVGYTAGQAVTTGSSNVILGAYTGNSGGLDIRTSSNNVVIADGQGNLRLSINSSSEITTYGTTHLRQISETVANNFNTNLAPSSGTLTVNTLLGTVILGDIGASVTTWAFTNVPTTNSKATTVTLIIDGDTTQTYGDACTVNGSAVTNGVKWANGTAPTATNNFDIITFTIVRDGAGTINVFGTGSTNFS